MMVNKDSRWGKVAVFAAAGLLVGGLGAGLVVNDDDKIEQLTADLAEAQNQTPEVVIETVEVAVDSGNLDLVLDHLYDNLQNDGNVNYLIDDLDDDEIEQITDRIVLINEMKDLAVAELKAEAADEIDKFALDEVDWKAEVPDVLETEFDEDDLERVRVQDDDDEVTIDDVDFEDSDANILASVNFEHELGNTDYKFVADFDVEIKDGEIDDLKLLGIRER